MHQGANQDGPEGIRKLFTMSLECKSSLFEISNFLWKVVDLHLWGEENHDEATTGTWKGGGDAHHLSNPSAILYDVCCSQIPHGECFYGQLALTGIIFGIQANGYWNGQAFLIEFGSGPGIFSMAGLVPWASKVSVLMFSFKLLIVPLSIMELSACLKINRYWSPWLNYDCNLNTL